MLQSIAYAAKPSIAYPELPSGPWEVVVFALLLTELPPASELLPAIHITFTQALPVPAVPKKRRLRTQTW